LNKKKHHDVKIQLRSLTRSWSYLITILIILIQFS